MTGVSSSSCVILMFLMMMMMLPIIISTTTKPAAAHIYCYESIISFGDSLADTGNLAMLKPLNDQPRSSRPPYGRTFFYRPTGRNSDGRIIIDFIAESLGLPFVQPYLGGGSFDRGVNFAVSGATALDYDYLEKRGIHNTMTNVSLDTQLDWFNQFLMIITNLSADHKKFLRSSLVLVGEIGGNDVNYLLQQGSTKEEAQSLAPTIVSKIGSLIEELIELGAETMLVPGNFPIGCLPIYLTQYKTSNKQDYDSKSGCINWLNEVSEYYNKLLQNELSRIRELHPSVTIIYADYYNVALRFYISPSKFGFSNRIHSACCGAGGTYNFNISAMCGIPPATSCDDPSSFASWDGVHFTEAAYRVITQGLLEGPYTSPRFKSICPSIYTHPGTYDH